jgi:hypothetical protein
MTCNECGKEYRPKRHRNNRYCTAYCKIEARKKRLISQRCVGDCIDCGLSKVLFNARVLLCFACKAKRTRAKRPPDWEAKKYAKRKENSLYADEAGRIWNRLRMLKETGGGHCCECGLRLNSYNRTQFCESCKRALNRLILTLSEAANLV